LASPWPLKDPSNQSWPKPELNPLLKIKQEKIKLLKMLLKVEDHADADPHYHSDGTYPTEPQRPAIAHPMKSLEEINQESISLTHPPHILVQQPIQSLLPFPTAHSLELKHTHAAHAKMPSTTHIAMQPKSENSILTEISVSLKPYASPNHLLQMKPQPEHQKRTSNTQKQPAPVD